MEPAWTRKKKKISFLSIALIGILLLSQLTPAVSLGAGNVVNNFQGFKAIVVGDVCNLRNGPGTTYPVIAQVMQGTWLDVVNVQKGWVKVSYKGREAYIADYLVDIDLESRNITARITRTDVNIRQGPGTSYPVIGMTQAGTTYPAQAKRGDWIRVSLGQTSSGWINAPLLQLEVTVQQTPPSSATGNLIVKPVSGKTVSVWQTAMQGSTLLDKLKPTDTAEYISSSGAYIAVKTPSGVKGFVYGPDVLITSASDPALCLRVSDSSWSMGKYGKTTVTATDVNFRGGPGTTYPVIDMVTRGDVLSVIETQGQWIHAISPKGVAGWVASWLTSGVSKDPQGFSVTLDAGLSSRTLTVTGPFQSSVVIPSQDGLSVKISTSIFFNAQAVLDVNCYEFGSIKLATSDVTVTFAEKPSFVVRENVPGRVVLEFSPAVTSVGVTSQNNTDVLTINTLGYAWPTVTRNGSSISLFLPGASYVGPGVDLRGQEIQKVDVTPNNNGLSLALQTKTGSSYVLRKTSNTISAYFPVPGLAGKVIVIDPGHGGNDPGAIGPTGLTERDVNWEIALRLSNLLRSAGAITYLTRQGPDQDATPPEGWNPGQDEYSGDLAKRTAWSLNANVFVSIHNDSNLDKSVTGTTSYVCDRTLNAAESRRLAQLIQKDLTASLGTSNKGVKDSNFFVTRESFCPSVLVEVMYISSPREESLLRQAAYLDKAAQGLFNALQEFFAPSVQ